MQILKDIEAIVGTKGILTGNDVANRKAGIWIDEGIKAKAIVRPKNTEELSKVLKICNEKKQPVVPHGGLTGLAEGAITLEGQIAISTESEVVRHPRMSTKHLLQEQFHIPQLRLENLRS